MPDQLRELRAYCGKKLVRFQFRNQRIRDVEQRAQAIALPHRRLPGKKAFHGYCELGGHTLQEFHFRRAGLIRRHRTETECAEPVLAGGERNEYEGAEPELGACAANKLRPASFGMETGKDQRPLVQPNPAGRIRLNRHPKACDHRIAWLIENMPVHDTAVGVVEYQPEMIEADDSAERFANAGEQGFEIGAPGDRSRKR